MIRRNAALLAFATALYAAPVHGQGVVTVSTAEEPQIGWHRMQDSYFVQFIRTPIDAIRVLSYKLYVSARDALTGDPVTIPDYVMGFAPVPNHDPTRGVFIDGNCECFWGAVGRYGWASGYNNDYLSALGQVGEGWIESRGNYQLMSSGGYDLPVRSEPLVGGEWLAFYTFFRYSPDVVMSAGNVGNAIYGWGYSDWGASSVTETLYGEDFRFEAKFVTVPEPSTFVMVLTGLLMMLGAAQRQHAVQRRQYSG